MNKKALIQQFTQELASELAGIRAAAEATYKAATDEDSKAENKYDTRGLEASYLAGAQAQRVSDMKEVLSIFENLPLKSFSLNDPILLTALVKISIDEKESHFLMMPKGGGQSTVFESAKVQVITPESPLGEALLGRKVGDAFEIEKRGVKSDCEILSVI